MKTILLFSLICSLNALSQAGDLQRRYENQKVENSPRKEDSKLASRGLNRFFFDGILGAGIMRDHGTNPQDEYGIITSIRVGNNFYLGKGDHPMIIRLTYLRIGITSDFGNSYLHIIPPQLGLVKHIKFNERASMEPGVHVAYIFNGQLSSGIGEFGLGVVYEIKFNISRFAMGIEYGTRKDTRTSSYYYQSYERFHYFGVSIGTRIGRGF